MALKGVPKSPEHRAKLAAANIGKHHSSETKAKMRAAKIGKTKSYETRLRMSAARKGMIFSDETCERMSVAAKARSSKPEERARLRSILAMLTQHPMAGLKHSQESKAKMSVARLGKPCAHKRRVSYKGLSFRSTWEVRAAKAFDALGMKWEYEPRRFRVAHNETYLPDFYLPDDGAYWEVKGFYNWISQRKVNVFRETYPEVPLVLLTEQGLKLLEQAASAKAQHDINGDGLVANVPSIRLGADLEGETDMAAGAWACYNLK